MVAVSAGSGVGGMLVGVKSAGGAGGGVGVGINAAHAESKMPQQRTSQRTRYNSPRASRANCSKNARMNASRSAAIFFAVGVKKRPRKCFNLT